MEPQLFETDVEPAFYAPPVPGEQPVSIYRMTIKRTPLDHLALHDRDVNYIRAQLHKDKELKGCNEDLALAGYPTSSNGCLVFMSEGEYMVYQTTSQLLGVRHMLGSEHMPGQILVSLPFINAVKAVFAMDSLRNTFEIRETQLILAEDTSVIKEEHEDCMGDVEAPPRPADTPRRLFRCEEEGNEFYQWLDSVHEHPGWENEWKSDRTLLIEAGNAKEVWKRIPLNNDGTSGRDNFGEGFRFHGSLDFHYCRRLKPPSFEERLTRWEPDVPTDAVIVGCPQGHRLGRPQQRVDAKTKKKKAEKKKRNDAFLDTNAKRQKRIADPLDFAGVPEAYDYDQSNDFRCADGSINFAEQRIVFEIDESGVDKALEKLNKEINEQRKRDPKQITKSARGYLDAHQLSVDELSNITGTGLDGRILVKDVKAYLNSKYTWVNNHWYIETARLESDGND